MTRSSFAGLLLLLAWLPWSEAHAQLAPWGKGESRGEDLSISLVTFGPSDEIISWFGHAAFVVEDRRLGQQRLYNYGMFTFNERMLFHFAMGRLQFWVGEDSVGRTLRMYRAENRDVRVQVLNLSPPQREALARALALNVLPENREYLYHHYDDNCSTRLRDGIDQAVGGALKKADSVPARMTLRSHTQRHSSVNPPMSVLLDFLMNDEIDRPITRWEEAFLPAELEQQVQSLEIPGPEGTQVPLVQRAFTYYRSDREPLPPVPPFYEPWLFAMGAGFAAVAMGLAFLHRFRSKIPRVLLGLMHATAGFVLGVPGTVLLIMWIVTNHTVTHRNENLFLANPFTLLALPWGIAYARGKVNAEKKLSRLWWGLLGLALFGLFLKLFALFNQDNARIVALILPVLGGLAAVHFILPKGASDGLGRHRAN